MNETTKILGITSGAAAALVGLQTEERFFAATETFREKPEWFFKVRRTSRNEDLNGFDAYVTIDIGHVPVQIKTSYGGADQYIRKYPMRKIVIMVITPNMNEHAIQLKLLFLLEKWREAKLARMRHWRKAWMPVLSCSLLK